MGTTTLPAELRGTLPPAVQEYIAYLEDLIRSTSELDVDLETASREQLIGLIFRLLERQQVIEARLRELQRQGKASKDGRYAGSPDPRTEAPASAAEPGKEGPGVSPPGSPPDAPASATEPGTGPDPLGEQGGGKQPPGWVKPNRPARSKKERKKRAQGYARRLDKPTHRVEHACEQCPECELPLQGGRVYSRRQVITLPRIRVRVTEHVILERRCDECGKTWRPQVDLSQEVVGQQRVGVSVQAEVAVLRQVCRMPFGMIQRYLEQCRGLHLSVGELVRLTQGVAERGKGEYEALREELRASPVVNADETGWRQDGQNGYLWGFSTPQVQYFLYRQSRAGAVVREVLGDEFEGVLGSDFYGAYNVHEGLHQRCWVHLLRAIHELKQRHPKDERLMAWATAVRGVYDRAKAYPGPDPSLPPDKQQAERVKAQRRFEQELWLLCEPWVKTDAPMRVLCKRIERFLPELFMFVADPRVPADNNSMERGLRPEVVTRKISGGTRSDKGSKTKSILATLFGTWHLQGRNLYDACRRLLASRRPAPDKGASGPAPDSGRSPPG